MLVLDELLLELSVLIFALFFKVVCQLDPSLPFLFPLLLLSNSEFIISKFPELREFSILILLGEYFPLLPDELVLPGLLNSSLHFNSPLLLLFE